MDNEEDIYMTSIHVRCASIPSSLENICLAMFAVSYESSFGKPAQAQDNEGTSDGSESEADNECKTP